MLQERGRGAVLVGVARVDAALEHLLQALMAQAPSRGDGLFLPDRPLGSLGAKVALAVLSTLTPSELANAIALQDKAAISRAPGVGPKVAANGWLMLAPVAADRSSYSPLLFLLLVAAACGLTFVLLRRLYHGRIRRSPPWDCGYPLLNARMQDTAEGFGQPIRQVFEPLRGTAAVPVITERYDLSR